MAGGDYDGDEYWTCWNSKLIQQIRRVYKPAEYLSPEKPKIEGEHTIDMIIDFILDILANSGKVGVLSRRHLALCAQYSPEHPKALEVAQYISDSLDFPKTGINSITSEILQRLNVRLYPVFMQNKTKRTYQSNKALDVLFQDVNDLHTYHSSHSTTVQPPVIDPDLVIDGYEEYIEQAKIEYSEYCNKMNVIMNTYDLNDETELITGCHFGTPEEPQNNDDSEIANQEFRALRLETKKIFETNIDRKYVFVTFL
jgi:RNA-dependent RNA polymerase